MTLHFLVERLDSQYFEMQERSENEPGLEGEAARLFSQARAVSALDFLGQADGLKSTMEALYEAGMSSEDVGAFYQEVLASLNTQ